MTAKRKNRVTGKFVTISTVGGEKARAFVPEPLPPSPPIDVQSLQGKIDDANLSLGRLDGMADILPDTNFFIHMYLQKEALLSSQIEGTQSSFSDLLLFESGQIPRVPIDDTEEVSNYIKAIEHGIKKLESGFPIHTRLMREIHGILLAGTRGSSKMPGEFRKSQNWIGGSRPGSATFVPPPPEYVGELMLDLEKFINNKAPAIPTLVKAGIMHVQFETIHPFLDGNGRLGRLLISLLLHSHGIMKKPILYLSLFFKTNRSRYYELLQNIRNENGWEDWSDFFLQGIIETSQLVTKAIHESLELFRENEEKINGLKKASHSAHQVHEFMKRKPISTIPKIMEALKLTAPTVALALKNLEKIGIVKESTQRQRNRIYVYTKFFDIISEGTEPI